MQVTRYAIVLTLLVTALAGERALMWSGALGTSWERGTERSRAELTSLARRWSRGIRSARETSHVFWVVLGKRLSARRVTLAVSRLVGRAAEGARLSVSEFRLPPPAWA